MDHAQYLEMKKINASIRGYKAQITKLENRKAKMLGFVRDSKNLDWIEELERKDGTSPAWD